MGIICAGDAKKGKKVAHKSLRDFDKSTYDKSKIDQLVQNEAHTTSRENINKVYNFKRVIGSGHFGTVRIATHNKDKTQKYAIKAVEKKKLKKDLHLLKRELVILKKIDHPNIVRFYETYQDEKYVYFVMELCTGGELLERIIKKGRLEETEVAKIMQKAFSAVKYLHGVGITHRDLKPENFLLESKHPDAELKLIDFGLSKLFADEPDKKMDSMVGTPLYVAPEVLRQNYDERCDNWSLGVMMYILLSGNPPFDGDNTNEIFKKIAKGRFTFSGHEWKYVSKQARDLISRLLVSNPERRISASDALNHEWFKMKFTTKFLDVDPTVGNLLKNFRNENTFKNEVLKVMINMLTEQELKKLRDNFRYFDKENTGYISVEELKEAMHKLGQQMSDDELDRIMDTIRVDKAQKFIKYSEFLTAIMDKKSYTNEQRLWAAFRHFDVDNSGYITAANIKEAMARAGRKIPDDQIQKMIEETDDSRDGKISFEEFSAIMHAEDDKYELKYAEDRMLRQDRSRSQFGTGLLSPIHNRTPAGSRTELDEKQQQPQSPKKKTFGDYLEVN